MKCISIAVAAALVAAPALAASKSKDERARAFQDLIDCRAITDTTARLACYDRTAATLDSAEKAKELVIVDRAQIKEAKKSVFGLTLPNIRLFGGDATPEIDRIETTVASAQENGGGQMVLRLPDGAVWVQSDDTPIPGRIAPGTKVTIKRGFAGSFFASVQGRPGFRVRRVNS